MAGHKDPLLALYDEINSKLLTQSRLQDLEDHERQVYLAVWSTDRIIAAVTGRNGNGSRRQWAKSQVPTLGVGGGAAAVLYAVLQAVG